MKKQGVLIYDDVIDRMDIRFGPLDYYGGLHCGERLEVLLDGEWIPTRIELGEFWYWIGFTQMLTGITWTPFGNTNSPGMPHTGTETTVSPKPWLCVCAQVLNADRICSPFFKTEPSPNGFPICRAFISPRS